MFWCYNILCMLIGNVMRKAISDSACKKEVEPHPKATSQPRIIKTATQDMCMKYHVPSTHHICVNETKVEISYINFSWAKEIQIVYHVCDIRKCEGHIISLIQ